MDNQKDFTNGNIRKQLITFSVPIILANMLQVSYQFIDSLWVGNLIGANALGSVAVASTVINVGLAFILGINNATLTILSQQRTRAGEGGLSRYLNAFVVLLTLLGVVASVAGVLFAESILQFLNTPEVMMIDATTYLKINSLGILFIIGYNFISTILQALGDSVTPLKIVFAATLLNTLLDPLFISTFKLGVNGAAIATILSQSLAFVGGLYYILRNRLAPFKKISIPAKEEVFLILNLGIPSGLQSTVIQAGIAALLSVVNSFGPAVTAGFSAAKRLDSMIIIPAQSLGTAANSMTGQNIGANKWKRVSKITKYGLLYNTLTMLVIACLLFIFAKPAIRLFLQEPASLQFGTQYLKLIAFFYPFLGINFILNGVVKGAGAMYQVLMLNVISFWVLRYPATYFLSGVMGEEGIALGMGFSFILSSFAAFSYYRWGRWREKELFSNR